MQKNTTTIWRKNKVFFGKYTIFDLKLQSLLHLQQIKEIAKAVGFDLCGVTRPRHFEAEEAFLRTWIEQGKGSTLGYLERNIDKRGDARLLVEGAKSVIVCGVAYKSDISNGYPDSHRTKIASYACTTDYHTTIKQMLGELCSRLKEVCPSLGGRIFTDSAPLFEKRYAVEAGLGWIGRQSLLVTPTHGTFVLLGEAVITEECDTYDEPLKAVGCGECRRCIEACPTKAVEMHHIDTRRCISRLTIEREEAHGTEVDCHGWVFGCDECQSCCPYNKRAPMATNKRFAPLFDPREMGGEEWQKIGEAEFSTRFAQTPLSRSSLERILRNIK